MEPGKYEASIVAVESKMLETAQGKVPVINVTALVKGGTVRGTLWCKSDDAQPGHKVEAMRKSSRERSLEFLRGIGWTGDHAMESVKGKKFLATLEHAKDPKYMNIKYFNVLPTNTHDATALAAILGSDVPAPSNTSAVNTPVKDDTDIPF